MSVTNVTIASLPPLLPTILRVFIHSSKKPGKKRHPDGNGLPVPALQSQTYTQCIDTEATPHLALGGFPSEVSECGDLPDHITGAPRKDIGVELLANKEAPLDAERLVGFTTSRCPSGACTPRTVPACSAKPTR